MRRARMFLALATAASSLVPGYLGTAYLIRGFPMLFCAPMIAVALTALTGSALLAVQALSGGRPQEPTVTARRIVAISFGAALLVGAAFLGVLAVIVGSKVPELVGWYVSYAGLSVVGLALGVASLVLARSSSAWAPPPDPEPEIILSDREPAGPLSPPEPRVGELLRLKRRLKEQGRT